MESIERMLECPECGELMSALVLDDLKKCDSCGCHARFNHCPPRPTEDCIKTCHREDCLFLPEDEMLNDFMAGRDY